MVAVNYLYRPKFHSTAQPDDGHTHATKFVVVVLSHPTISTGDGTAVLPRAGAALYTYIMVLLHKFKRILLHIAGTELL